MPAIISDLSLLDVCWGPDFAYEKVPGESLSKPDTPISWSPLLNLKGFLGNFWRA